MPQGSLLSVIFAFVANPKGVQLCRTVYELIKKKKTESPQEQVTIDCC